MIQIQILLAMLTAADPAGWTKAKWGMTEAQVIEAFAGQAVRIENPLPACTLVEDGRKTPAQVAIHSVPIGPTTYRACLYFEGSGLHLVRLTPTGRNDADRHEFQRVEAALVEKYGKPFHREADGTDMSQWTLGTTRITLKLVSVMDGQLRFLDLEYELLQPSSNL